MMNTKRQTDLCSEQIAFVNRTANFFFITISLNLYCDGIEVPNVDLVHEI